MGKTIIPSINMTGLPSEPTWYLVITKYNHEDAFAKDLLKGLKDYRMEDKIIDCCTFLEEIQEEKVNKKGELKVKVKVNKPFMNYVAVKAIMNNDVWNYIMMRKEVIVKEMAERYGLPICDCCFEWYNPNRANEAIKYWQSDKLHLTSEGHQAVIDKLEKVVNNLPFTRN